MDSLLHSLWVEHDRASDPTAQAESRNVLADCYEESGQNSAAEILRTYDPDWLSNQTQQVHEAVSRDRLAPVLQSLSNRSVRLFACACVDQLVQDSWDQIRQGLRVFRRYEFDLETKSALVEHQHRVYDRWEDDSNFPNHQTNQETRELYWAVVRASGFVSRIRHPDNIVPDAQFAARYAERGEGLRSEGWTVSRQLSAAIEYRELGRLIQESQDVKDIWEQVWSGLKS